MIQAGELPPGSTISESELCAALAISRTPLREALKVLASENLVQLRPHRMPLVAPVDPAAGALACQRASTAEINELCAMHSRLAGLYTARDRTGYYTLNQAIHHEIMRLAGTFRLTVLKNADIDFLLAETPTHLMSIGLNEDLGDAAKQAVSLMVKQVCRRTNLSRNQAYMLYSLTGDLRVTQLVDIHKGVHMLLPKSAL